MAEKQDSKLTIITTKDVDKCKKMVSSIMEAKKPVAMDAEGVSLGPQGRMTLMQFGTFDGQVYIIDLVDEENPNDTQKAKQLLCDGNLKTLLESKVIKVIHSCENDSGALWHQFGIKLQTVFDTQIAHLVIQEKQGVLLPERLRLDVLSQTYGGHTHSCKDIASEFKEDKEFWARRPLTEDMLKYAAEDVRTIVPKLYEELEKKINSYGIRGNFKMQTAESIDLHQHKDRVCLSRANRTYSRLRPVWRGMEKHSSSLPEDALKILTEDEKRSLNMLKPGTKPYDQQHPFVKKLVEVHSKSLLSEWVKKIEEEGPGILENWQKRRAEVLTRHNNPNIRKLAGQVLQKAGQQVSGKRQRASDTETTTQTKSMKF